MTRTRSTTRPSSCSIPPGERSLPPTSPANTLLLSARIQLRLTWRLPLRPPASCTCLLLAPASQLGIPRGSGGAMRRHETNRFPRPEGASLIGWSDLGQSRPPTFRGDLQWNPAARPPQSPTHRDHLGRGQRRARRTTQGLEDRRESDSRRSVYPASHGEG